MSDIALRPMRWPDIQAVHGIETEVFEVDPWTAEQFWGELAQSTREYVVAENDGAIIGYAGAYLLAPDADVQTIAVSPAAQGRGVGRLLLEQLIAIAVRHDCSQLLLEVRSDNASAIAMYKRFGFEAISTRRDYYATGVDARIMRLRPLPHAAERGEP
ncbi:MAG: ribosomal protein S18-alanine N-acetyltransferase [Candidatus Nanopelagicales bacterium]